MKRSEMVNAIWRRLAPLGIGSETCEEVLSIIEKEGMLPPLRSVTYEDSFWDEAICAEMDGMDIRVSSWDKEETKEYNDA
jgi:hypothetical protein